MSLECSLFGLPTGEKFHENNKFLFQGLSSSNRDHIVALTGKIPPPPKKNMVVLVRLLLYVFAVTEPEFLTS